MIAAATKSGAQDIWYQPGVGTAKVSGLYEFIAMSLLNSTGLVTNIEEAYRVLCERYRPGDSIYLIGFSRGHSRLAVLQVSLGSSGF